VVHFTSCCVGISEYRSIQFTYFS